MSGVTGGAGSKSGVIGQTHGGIKEADMWRLTSGFTGNHDLNDNMERVDDATFSKIGTGMDFTNTGDATWTFPSTGIWFMQASPVFFYNGNSAYNFATIEGYNGSSWDTLSQGSTAIPGASNSIDDWCQLTVYVSAFLDVQNTTSNKVKFSFTMGNQSVQVLGDSAYNRTYFTFIRLGDT